MENKIIKTVTVLEVCQPLPGDLQKGLGYAAAPWWEENGRLYILNCALADGLTLCRNAKKEEFLWGAPGISMGRYQAKNGKKLADAPADALPADLLRHAVPIFHEAALSEALNEERTFLSRAAHRRTAYRF